MPRTRKLVFTLALCLAVAGADAKPLFLNGGAPIGGGGGGGSPSACDGGSSVCAQFQAGQTFVTWDDVGKGGGTPGATGASYRYRVYRSTSPITSGNYTGATLVASYITNNSGQLAGGDPSPSTYVTNSYTQSFRQDGTKAMSVLSDLGTPLAAFTGLQAYTAKATANAYYAVVSTNTSDASPSYIGSAGPIAESVATPQAIKYADSASRIGQTYGIISGATNLPLVYKSHAFVDQRRMRHGVVPVGLRV